MHQPNHKTEDFFDILDRPEGVVPKNKNFEASPLTLGEKVIKYLPSQHKDPKRKAGQERGLKNFVDLFVPQTKVDVGLTLATAGPIGRVVGRGVSAAAKYAKPSMIRNKFGNIYKFWEDTKMSPSEFKKKKPLTLIENMTGEEVRTIESGKKVGSIIKKGDNQMAEWVQKSQENDYALQYTLQRRGKPFKKANGKWDSELKSAMEFQLEDVPKSQLVQMGYPNIKKAKMIKGMEFQYNNATGTGSQMDHGRLLRDVFDRFEGNWMIGNSEGNSFTVDSMNMMLKSVLRRADEIRFEPQSFTTYSNSDLSLVSKAADRRRQRLNKLRGLDTTTPQSFADERAVLDSEYMKKIEGEAEAIIQTLWRSGKVQGAKSIDDVREMSGFTAKSMEQGGQLGSNRFLVTSFKGEEMFSIQDYKLAIAGILGVKMADVSGVLEDMFPDAE
jgi:hypothetical protein